MIWPLLLLVVYLSHRRKAAQKPPISTGRVWLYSVGAFLVLVLLVETSH